MKLNRRLIREANHSHIAIILSIFLGFVGGILTVLQAREISRVINRVFLEGKALGSISSLVLAILILIVLRAVFVWGGEICASAAARKIKQDLRNKLFSHILDIGPAYLRSEQGESEARTGELINVAIEGIDALDVYFSQYLPQIALSALIPLTILIFVFPSDPLSGIVLLFTAPLLPIFMYLIGSAAEILTRKQWHGLSRMSAYFLDVLQGLTTLKSLGRSRDQIEVIKKVSEHYRQSTMGVLRVTFLSALALELVATLSTAVVAVEIGIRLLYGRMAFEQAFFILLLAPEFYLPLRLLGTRFHAGMAGVEAAKRIFEILDIPKAEASLRSADQERPPTRQKTPPSIVFKDVSFTYSNNHPVLQGISFEIPAGKITALMGESGAGKTTLTWLLLRFLQPNRGDITVDGKHLNEIPALDWRADLAWVPQNPYLFNDTVLANINLAQPNADQDAIQHAAHLASADDFIEQLPQGYATVIGEHGMRLSAGEAQRIALARAFLKDAPFIILDEATSHLDPETDALLQESLRRLSLGRTVLVIAHHQSTLSRADQVIRLHQGRVEEIQEIKTSHMPVEAEVSRWLPKKLTQIQPEIKSDGSEFIRSGINESRNPTVTIRLLKLLSPFTGRILLSVFLGFATVASGVGLMATAAYIISAAALHPSIAELQVAIVGVRFFGLSRAVFRYLERLVSHDVTFRLLARWRVWFYQALEPLAPARLMRYHSGELLSRVINDIGTLENYYVRTVAPPLVALLVSIAISLFLGGFSVQLAWGLIFFLILAGVGLPVFVLVLSKRVGTKIIQTRAQLSTVMIDGFQGMPDLLTCDQATPWTERVNQIGKRLTGLQARMAVLTAMQTALGGLLANLGMLTVLVLAIQRVSHGQLDGVFLGVAALSALTCFEALQPLPTVAQNFEGNHAAAHRLYELVDATPTVVDPIEPLQLNGETNLEVQNLSFQYPLWMDEENTADILPFELKNISFSVPQGKHIAIVGSSGSGKTTLVGLLLRYWEYQQGSIRLNGNELQRYRQDDIRKRIGIISQNTYLFSATINENLLIACPQATHDEIIQATQAAQLYDFIQSLPAGYDTWIAEHGLRLSAGERQRLAIARAILKDAPLLILDEPTANLDPANEMAVLNSIEKLSQGRSTITITQRMLGLETMDEILVLRNGRIIEHGRHDQLLLNQGFYKRIWDLYHQIL